MKDRLFGDRAFLSKLVRLSGPIVFQSLMLAMVAVSDAIMLGSIRQDSMSAVSLASQIQFIQNVILGGLTSATAVLSAQYWGRKDTATVRLVLNISLRASGLLSLLFFAGCTCFPELLMQAFTNEPVLITIGADYLRIAGWSYLLTGISQIYLAVMKVSEHTLQAAVISSFTVVLNIALNAAFIFGIPGLLPAMEVRGAAIATLISRVAETALAMLLSARPGYVQPDWKRFFRRNRLLSADFRRCVLPLVGAGLFWGVGFASYSAFIGHLGTDAVAANSVASVVRDLVCCLGDGIAGGGGIMIGHELGAGRLDRGRLYGDRLVWLSILSGLLSAAVMLCVTPLVTSLVELTEGASSLLTGMMIIMAVYMIGRAMNTITINGIFAAGGDTMFDMYSLAVSMWALAVPLAALGTFVFHWPVLVVYACTCLDEVGKIPWVLVHYKKYIWVKDLTRDLSTEV